MTVSEGRRMDTKSLRRIINLLKGHPNINNFLLPKLNKTVGLQSVRTPLLWPYMNFQGFIF